MKKSIFFFAFIFAALTFSTEATAQTKSPGVDYERIEISKSDALTLLKESNNKKGYDLVNNDRRSSVRYELVEAIRPNAKRAVDKNCYRPKRTTWGVELHRVVCFNDKRKPRTKPKRAN